MQEEIAIKKSKHKRRHISLETRQSHVAKWKQSGVRISEYCRSNDLALSSFSAWVKAHQLTNQVFKPVLVKSSPVPSIKSINNVIEILILDKLKIRLIDVTNASLVLDITKELIRCS